MHAETGYINEQYCRLCSGNSLKPILDLGMQPLANALSTTPQREQACEVYPLNLMRCDECGLVQILQTVEPHKLFSEYLYFSSYSQTLVDNAMILSDYITGHYNLKPDSLVVEIGSNDGYLLQFYKKAGLRVLGVEPAVNVAEVAVKEHHIPTRTSFFSEEAAMEIREQEGTAEVIHAHNVLAHLASLHSVIEGISLLLSNVGIGVFEVVYVYDMIEAGSFDMIYHEHLCFYSLATIEKLLETHGLFVFDVEHISTHGGSLRVFASKRDKYSQTKRLLSMRRFEIAKGVDKSVFYTRFAERVGLLKKEVTGLLDKLYSQEKTIVAYGAAAKATVMLNYFGIRNNQILYIVDRSPYKQGKFVPGTNLEIYPVEKILEDKPDYLLLTAWNLADEIIKQQEEYRSAGGRFILPLPELQIV